METELHVPWHAVHTTHTVGSVVKSSHQLCEKKKQKNKPTWNPLCPLGWVDWPSFITSDVRWRVDSIKSNLSASQAPFAFQQGFQRGPRAVGRNQIFISFNKHSPTCRHIWTFDRIHPIYLFFSFFFPVLLKYRWHITLFKVYNMVIWCKYILWNGYYKTLSSWRCWPRSHPSIHPFIRPSIHLSNYPAPTTWQLLT